MAAGCEWERQVASIDIVVPCYQYARFLRENHQVEDAEVVERQIRQAEGVIDVRSLQTQKGVFSFADLK